MLDGRDRRRSHADDRHDSRARDGRGAAGERRASRHRDGARAGRLSALPRRDASQPGRSVLARTRPLRPLRRPRLHAPVRGAPPLRLRRHARRPEAVPPVGLAHTRASGARPHRRHRDDDRPARTGLRERRRHRDRAAVPGRALQPPAARARRLVGLRDLLRRRHDGRRHPRGRLHRRAPGAGPARLRLRRQPHHDRRNHLAHLHDRGQGQALRGVRLARPARRRRGGPRCAARCLRGREGRGGASLADRAAQPHRLPRPERRRHLEGARRAARRRRGARDQGADGLRSRRDLRSSPTRCAPTWRSWPSGARSSSESGRPAAPPGRTRIPTWRASASSTWRGRRARGGARRCRSSRPARRSRRGTRARR